MEHIIKRTPRLDIDIDTKNHTILIIQRWKYNWKSNGFGDWSYSEKQKMHEALEKEMDIIWNRRAKLKTIGNSGFAQKHKKDVFRLFFDIKWVLTNEHWNVDISKVASTDLSNRPYVNWNTRKINLYSIDINSYRKVDATIGITQKNITHEFGHAIGNSSPILGQYADEYKSGGSFNSDKLSIMNVGMQLRLRHFDFILREINSMLPNTNFILSI